MISSRYLELFEKESKIQWVKTRNKQQVCLAMLFILNTKIQRIRITRIKYVSEVFQ